MIFAPDMTMAELVKMMFSSTKAKWSERLDSDEVILSIDWHDSLLCRPRSGHVLTVFNTISAYDLIFHFHIFEVFGGGGN